jgi:hypothetical protein
VAGGENVDLAQLDSRLGGQYGRYIRVSSVASDQHGVSGRGSIDLDNKQVTGGVGEVTGKAGFRQGAVHKLVDAGLACAGRARERKGCGGEIVQQRRVGLRR